MNIGNILLSKRIGNEDVERTLARVTDPGEVTVINDLEECLSITKETKWVVLYTNVKSERYPCHISPDGVFIDHSRRFEIAKYFNFRIAWCGTDDDPNPYKWYAVYPNGVEWVEYLTENDIE